MSLQEAELPTGRVIRAAHPWTQDVAIAAMKAHYRHAGSPVARGTRRILPPAFAAGGLGLIASGIEPAFGAVLLALGLCMLVLLPLSRRQAACRQFATSAYRDSKVEWQFYDEGFAARTPLSSASHRWEALVRALETREGFLLYYSDQHLHYVMKIAFDPDDLADFRALLRARVARFSSL